MVRRHASSLVNVNGSIGRGSAAVDMNTIPTAIVKSVEVLRDGAAAQYGSDAISGVVNLRLRTDRTGGEASVTYGARKTEYDLWNDVAPAGARRTRRCSDSARTRQIAICKRPSQAARLKSRSAFSAS